MITVRVLLVDGGARCTPATPVNSATEAPRVVQLFDASLASVWTRPAGPVKRKIVLMAGFFCHAESESRTALALGKMASFTVAWSMSGMSSV